jgi:hypothetical protein
VKMDQNRQQDGKWFELMRLAHRCPSTVNGITIMGPARLILWCLAYHADSETASTIINSGTLTREVGCSHNTLDSALHDLILAGLVSQSARFDQRRIVGSVRRTINRELLENEVAAAAYVAGLGDLGEQDYAGFYGPEPEVSDEHSLEHQDGSPDERFRGRTEKAAGGDVAWNGRSSGIALP